MTTPQQIPSLRPDPDPRQCSICMERFAEEWMATRCQAQGPPIIEYRIGDVVANKAGQLFVCGSHWVHHAFGVKCNVEGPCPHDVTYYGCVLAPGEIGIVRVFIASFDWRQLRKGWEKIATLTIDTEPGMIPESGKPEELLVGPYHQEEWDKLWSHYPERRGRRGGRRLEGL